MAFNKSEKGDKAEGGMRRKPAMRRRKKVCEIGRAHV